MEEMNCDGWHETETNRLYICCANSSSLDALWIIGGRAPSPGALRIYTVWLEEFDPDYVLALISPTRAYYAYRVEVERSGKLNHDKRGVYYTLPRACWHKADIARLPETGSTT